MFETLALKRLASHQDHVLGFERAINPAEMEESSVRTARSGLGTP